MKNKDFLIIFLTRIKQKIYKFQQQWKGTRYAALDDSNLDPEEDDENQYQQFLQKYRGKNGDIKPLGLILYGKYLRSLFILFLALTLFFVPVSIIYCFGGGLSQLETGSFSKSILLFSVANLPHYRIDDLSSNDILQINFHRYVTVTTDVISVFVIFIFLMYLKIEITKITNDYMAKCPSPHFYCLQVENISDCQQEDLKKHFSKLGKVAQISCIYTHQNTIYDISKIIKLISYLCMLKPDQQHYETTVEKIRKKYFEIAENYLQMEKPKLKSIFLCFQSIMDRNRVYDLYKYDINPQNLDLHLDKETHQIVEHNEQPTQKNLTINEQSKFYSQTHKTKIAQNKSNVDSPQQKMLTMGISRSKIIRPKVKKCKFEPLTINWENCDIDKKSQRIKFLCQFLLLVIVAFVILLGLFLLNINSTHVKQSFNKASAKGFQNKLAHDAREKYTFCASLKLSDLKWQHYYLCAEYFELERNKFVLMLTFSLMVAVINLLTNRILWALVAFRRYRTLAQRNHFLVTSIFFFSFINGAILTLLIRGQYTGPMLRAIVGKILNFPEDVMQVTVYSQFNRQWYLMIGSQLMMNYIVSLIVFPHFHIILHWVRSKYRSIMRKHTQKQMKKPVFNYCTFYAMSLKAMFFCLMYSNSMPIFYFLCCIALAVQIGLGKILMAKFVEQPVFVDNNTIDVVINIIPYALLFHCLTSILFLNVEQMFPTINSYKRIDSGWLSTNLLKLQRGFIYAILFVFIAIYIWNRARIDKIVLQYWIGRNQSTIQCDQTRKFKQIKINPAFLASYKMKDNPKYKLIYYALQLFCSHMQKIRLKGGIDELKSHESLDISNLFTQQNTNQNVFTRGNHQKLEKHHSISATFENENMNSAHQYESDLVESEVWEDEFNQNSDRNSETQSTHKNELIKANQ